MVGEAPPEEGEPSRPARREAAQRGRHWLFPLLSRIKAVCALLKTRETQKKEKGQGGSVPLSSQPQETRSHWESEPSESPARAAEPEPTTKGHSQSGLIRPGAVPPRSGTPGAFRARAQSGRCGGRGKVLGPLIPRQG